MGADFGRRRKEPTSTARLTKTRSHRRCALLLVPTTLSSYGWRIQCGELWIVAVEITWARTHASTHAGLTHSLSACHSLPPRRKPPTHPLTHSLPHSPLNISHVPDHPSSDPTHPPTRWGERNRRGAFFWGGLVSVRCWRADLHGPRVTRPAARLGPGAHPSTWNSIGLVGGQTSQ